MGVAVGGITTAFGMVVDAFFSLGYWIPLGIIGIILAISVPSVIVAGLKLRMRSLAPILDANGWAINCKASVSALFGSRLTRLANAALAAGARPKGRSECPRPNGRHSRQRPGRPPRSGPRRNARTPTQNSRRDSA